MESGMKHDGELAFLYALPDAPLPMPKQVLERVRRPLLPALLGRLMAAFPRP
jgi:hypothetical protein